MIAIKSPKKNLSWIYFALLTIICLPVSGQKTMKIDTDLKDSSTFVLAKRYKMSKMNNYQMGAYKVVSLKGGLTSSTSI